MALKGIYGDAPITTKGRQGTVWINPLMPVYWCFSLLPVAQRILYANFIQFLDVVMIVESWRKTLKNFRPKKNIPV